MYHLLEKFTENINNILGIKDVNRLAVAVSGGSDSVALLHLVLEWAAGAGVEVTVFSVDHNLRPESKLEIAYIQELADKFGFQLIKLSWHSNEKTTAIQERAREARYDLISGYCRKLNIELLLTAHHQDDMLETYLMKKSKKASNLSLMPNITYFHHDLQVERPLFNFEKKELIDFLQKNNIKWFEDSSNELDKYERNRVRKQLAAMSVTEKVKLLAEYETANQMAKELNELLLVALAEVVSIYNYGFAKIELCKFKDLSEELKIQVLNYALTIVSGKTMVPRYRNLDRIIKLISDNNFQVATLSHCKLSNNNGNIIIYKETSFVSSEEVNLSDKAIWDNRFEITLCRSYASNNFIVTNLTSVDYIQLKNSLDLEKLAKESNNNHKNLLFTLPVIKKLEKLVAIPHISYYDIGTLKGNIKAIFKPNFVSRFTHFF